MNPEEYAVDLLGEDDVLRRVQARSREAGLPTIAVGDVYGRLLTLLVAASRAERVLEIGTLGGYGAVCLARGLGPGGRLVSLEIDPTHAAVAEANLRDAGFGDRAMVRIGDARESLRALEREGETFDFIFIDADKESYPDYLQAVLRLARPGALVAADNALFHGRVLDPQDGTAAARALRAFTRTLTTHPRLTSVLLPAYDGLLLARVAG